MKIFGIAKKPVEENIIISRLEKIAARENTTVEDVVSRLEPGFVVKFGIDYYKGYVIDQYECPHCKKYVGDELTHFKYCPSCGKALINV